LKKFTELGLQVHPEGKQPLQEQQQLASGLDPYRLQPFYRNLLQQLRSSGIFRAEPIATGQEGRQFSYSSLL
jgi:hypothetical protein